MQLGTELEKLTSLRNQGDLSPAEFDAAKTRLLSGEVMGASQAAEADAPPLPAEGKRGGPKQHHLLIAILSTIVATFSAGSVVIAPGPISLLAFSLFAFAAALNWMEFFKGRRSKRS